MARFKFRILPSPRSLSVMAFFPILFFSGCKAQENRIVAETTTLQLVSDAYEFTEGPAVDGNGDVYFTDQPNDRILKWEAKTNTVSEWLSPSGRSNGLYMDQNGNLLACADEKNELWQIAPDRSVTVLIDNYQGNTLGGPNDLWIAPDGNIYFTDPLYERPWWNHSAPQISERRVYFYNSTTKTLQIAAEGGYQQPNGIIGSPDGKTLYIADNDAKKTYAFTINGDGSITDRVLFAEMGSDGMTIDQNGNIYLTGDGVTVFDSDGKKLRHIPVPEKWTANVTFGGADRKTLFITAMDSVYTLEMLVAGAY
ncbi:SMP-30/gluconolactonase/LRE family protein [Maribacter sp. 2-571]|uniref:SMP-30/gluconolactonase/LRE family protein n=1 Tax=Maribacter sp. 2-571 TaxID=3417569 RepID=UPI003D34105B